MRWGIVIDHPEHGEGLWGEGDTILEATKDADAALKEEAGQYTYQAVPLEDGTTKERIHCTVNLDLDIANERVRVDFDLVDLG